MTGHLQNGSRRRVTALVDLGRPHVPTVKTQVGLLTNSWTADVQTVAAAIAGFTTKSNKPLADDCKVMLFELEGDTQLHVNVIHRCERVEVHGWSGPGRLADGCVYNRRFGETSTNEIIRHIREMVFA